MTNLSIKEINWSIKKANQEIEKYFLNTASSNFNFIKIDTTKNIKQIKNKKFKYII